MQDDANFKDSDNSSGEGSSITGRNPVVPQEHNLVLPVADDHECEASWVQAWNGGRIHHDDEHHGDKLGVSVLNLELSTAVHHLIFLLDDLFCSRIVAGAAAITTAFAASLDPEATVRYRTY